MKKVLSKIVTIIKIICTIVLVLLIAVLALQRFSNNEIAIGGYRVFTIVTTSMIPVYDVGDTIVIKEVTPEELKLGDDITYLGKVESFKDRVVTHRLIQINPNENGETLYRTQGVANESPDPEITFDQIYGKVIYKCFLISALAKLMNNMTLFYIVVFIPLAILIMLQIKDVINEHRSEDAEEDDEDDEEDDDEDEDEEDEDDEEDDDE